MTQVGSLTVDLIAQTASFNANITKAANNLNSQSAKMNRSLAQIQGGINKTVNAGKALAGAFVIGAVVAAGKRALDYASSLGEVSQQLGVTTRDLQTYRYAASQVGIAQEEMDKGLAKLTQSLGKARVGADAPAKAFGALSKIIGVDIVGTAKTAGDALPLMAEALSKIKDPAQRAAIEVALLGKTGQKLDTLLAGGRAQLDNLANAAKRLGIVLSDEQIRKADDAADKLSALKQVLEARIAGVVADNATGILNLANAVGTLAGAVSRFMSTNPQTALAIIGGLAGARFGGLPGAGVGAALGVLAGDQMQASASNSNNDLGFRRKQLDKALAELRARQNFSNSGSIFQLRQGNGSQSGGTLATAQAEVRRQADLLRRAATAARLPKAVPSAAGVDVEDFLASGGGGKGKGGKSDAQKAAEDAIEAAKKLNEEYQQQTAELSNQIRFQDMRADGLEQQADVEEAIARLHEQLPGLDAKRMGILEAQTKELIAQKYAIDAAKDAQDAFNDAADKAKDIAAETNRKVQDWYDDQARMADDFAQQFAGAFTNAADAILQLKSPMAIIRGLVTDLAEVFQRTFILEPLQNFVAQKFGTPLASKLGIGTQSFPGADVASGELIRLSTSASAAALALSGIGNMTPGGVSGGGLLGTLLSVGKGLAGSIGGGGLGLSDSFIKAGTTNLFDTIPFVGLPGRASGGPVNPGGMYLVGENGPEILKMGGAGFVTPHAQSTGFLRAMGNMRPANDRGTNHYNITVQGGGSERDNRRTGQQIAVEIQRSQARAARNGIAA